MTDVDPVVDAELPSPDLTAEDDWDGPVTLDSLRASRPERDAPVSPPLLRVIDLRVRFHARTGDINAVRGVDLHLDRGRTLGIVGESGSGKSVTAKSIMGLLPSSAAAVGSILFEGSELMGMSEKQLRERRGRDIAIVFQDPMRSLNPTMQVGRQIAEAIRNHFPVSRAEATKQARTMLELVRIPAPRERSVQYPHQLSGGMRQRVMIAIALACRPKLLIADEPTTALDVTTQAQILKLLRDLQQELDMGLILVSHDLGVVAELADTIAVMYAGRVVEVGPTETLLTHPLMPYTEALLRSVPRVDHPRNVRLVSIDGDPPDPMALPIGCAFQTRCRYTTEKCLKSEPPLAFNGQGRGCACWNPVLR